MGAAGAGVKPTPLAGTRIALTGVSTPCEQQICTVDAVGGSVRQLTSQAILSNVDPADCNRQTDTPPGRGPCFAAEPSFSKNGTRIAFSVVGNGYAELWVMSSDGKNLTPLAATANFAGIGHPTWSPDGRTIAFAGSSEVGGPLRIWTIQAAGTDLTALTDPSTQSLASEPAWSPDGRLIAFTSFEGNDANGVPNPSGIYVMNADGTNIRRLTPSSAGPQQDPAWSPNSKWLAFSQLSPDWRNDHVATIAIVNADGTDVRLVTKGGFWDGSPVISPDGSKIAFGRYRGTQVTPHVFVMNIHGAELRQLLTMEASPSSWANVSDQTR